MPGTAFLMAFSMTVEPFSASMSNSVPSKAMMWMVVMKSPREAPAEIITPPAKSTARRRRAMPHRAACS
jgi:hypothetical protein